MAKTESIYTLKFEGFTELVKLNDELKAQKKILEDLRKTQGKNSEEYLTQAEAVGRLQAAIKAKKEEQAAETKEMRKSIAEQERAAKQSEKEKDEYVKKSRILNDLRHQYKALAAAGKGDSDFAQGLLTQISKLDKELKDIDAKVGQFQRSVGNYEKAFGGIQSALGGDIGGLLASTGAGLAAVAAVEIGAEIAQQVKEITDRYRNLRKEIGLLTGATGEALSSYTSEAAAIADTFGADTQEVILAANALSKNLGIDFKESLNLIADGYLAGADASGEFLDTVTEYSVFAKEGKLDAEAFIGVISQSVTSGVFSDKGIDALKEAQLRLREMPTATTDALASIGITSDEIQKAIGEKGLTGAVELVTQRMSKFGVDSKEVGSVVSNVFGSAGEDAGAQFLMDTFTNLDVSMSDLAKTSDTLLNAQRTLKDAENELSEALSGSSASFDVLTIQAKTLAIEGLIGVINAVKDFISIFKPMYDLVQDVRTEFEESGKSTGAFGDILNTVFNPIERVRQGLSGMSFVFKKLAEFAGMAVGQVRKFAEWLNILDTKAEKTVKSMAKAFKLDKDDIKQATDELKKRREETEKGTKENEKAAVTLKQLQERQTQLKDAITQARINGKAYNKELAEYKKITKQIETATNFSTKATKDNTKAKKENAEKSTAQAGSVADLTQKISTLNKEITETADKNVISKKLGEIVAYEAQLESLKDTTERLRRELERPTDATDKAAVEVTGGTITGGVGLSETLQGQIDAEEQARVGGIERYIQSSSEKLAAFYQMQKEEAATVTLEDIDNQQLAFSVRLAALDEYYSYGEMREEEYQEKRKELIQQATDYGFSVASAGLNAIADLQNAMLARELAAAEGNEQQQEEIRRKYAKKQQRIATLQAIVDGAAGIVKTGANLGYPLAIPFQIAQGIQTIAQIATIQAQAFATGGRVLAPNIPQQSNGDNVLATVRTGEVVLTEAHQALLGGAATFAAIGVKGFATGGRVGASLPVPFMPSAAQMQLESAQLTAQLAYETASRFDRIEVVADARELVSKGNSRLLKKAKFNL